MDWHFFKKIFLLLFLFFYINPFPVNSQKNLYKNIRFSGFSKKQIQKIKETFDKIKSIKRRELRINKNIYERFSSFQKLFGFQFDGNKLFYWILNRFDAIEYHNGWTVAINRGKGLLLIGDDFFSSPIIERMYILVHEARHSDGFGHSHVSCPRNFVYISVGQPNKLLPGAKGCDDKINGAYGFQAAFVFELFAYGIVDQTLAGFIYNGTLLRILPYHKF